MTRTVAIQYLILCAIALTVALAALIAQRRHIALLQGPYWRWLLAPWKIATATISATALVVAAPYMGDRDWDAGVALLMSVLTFTTAPWAIAELWRRRSRRAVYIAACAWLLSSSWSFDVYWYVRRGFYPDNWFGNMIASSVLYVAAGVLWNLDATDHGRWKLAFTNTDWPPRHSPVPFRRLAAPAIAMMALVGGAVFLPFLIHRP